MLRSNLVRAVAALTITLGMPLMASGGALAAAAPTAPLSGLQPLSPARLLDTRTGTSTIDGQFAGTGAVGGGGSLNIRVTGRGGVPATGVAAVVLNVTATAPSATTYVTVWPTDAPQPTASNLNATPGRTVANGVVVGLGTDGMVSLFNSAGSTHLIADVVGWFPAGASFTAVTPARLMDTRPGAPSIDGQFAGQGAVGTNTTVPLTVAGRGGVPETGVSAVALTVTADQPTATSFVTVWPSGAPRPNASNLNVIPDSTVANLAVVGVGTGGQVSLYNESGDVHLLVDVAGWFGENGAYHSLTPARVADFRAGGSTVDGQFRGDARLAPGESRSIRISGRGGVPLTAGAVVLNVTITEPSAPSYITVWPGGEARPNASNVNVGDGRTVANLVVAKVGADGDVNVYNEAGTSRLIIDVEGWFEDPAQAERALAASGGVFAHSCAINRGEVWCWGDNSSGQLGNGSAGAAGSPVRAVGVSSAIGVATGNLHSCAVGLGGGVQCWGGNVNGQLGDGTATDRPAPTVVPGLSSAVAVTAGERHTCALLAGGSIQCWGFNANGQLGNGTIADSAVPVTVTGITDAVAVSAGGSHTCALTRAGSVQCWGSNGSGQLGNGSSADASSPVAVSGLSGAVMVAAGDQHSCALVEDGTARCWGNNVDGRLGDGTTNGSATPVTVQGLTNATSIAAGPTRTCATALPGYAYCWGNNTGRALGNGSNDPSSAVPVPVYGLVNAESVAVATTHSCAALGGGGARCWGLNLNGQLGDGTTTSSGSPVAVLLPS